MLKYGPTINIEIAELSNIPIINTPVGSAPKIAVDRPNTVKINQMSVETTPERTTVIIINPR